MNPIIQVHNVSFRYPARDGSRANQSLVLRNLSLDVAQGEYIAIVGANGSGKSTLARMLNALLLPDSGEVMIDGMDTRETRRHLSIRQTVGMVFQRPEEQIIASTIHDDVAFGPENLGLTRYEIVTRSQQALEAVGMWEMRDRAPHQLSAGQMQRVALAGVLAMRPLCIVFDEATAMLDPLGRRDILAMMRRLHADGLTVLHITHQMEEVLDAQRVIVMHHGGIVADTTPENLFTNYEPLLQWELSLPPLASLSRRLQPCIGSLTSPNVADIANALHTWLQHHCTTNKINTQTDPGGETVLALHSIHYTYMPDTPLAHIALNDVSMTLHTQQCHGLLGATGSGKSTLLQHCNGLLQPQQGQVIVMDKDINVPDANLRQVRCDVGLVFQLPEAQMFEQYVGDEIAYGPGLAGLQGDALRERVRWAMELVGLDFEGFKDRLSFNLSGGEKRKVALASILALKPQVLLLDEPTAGLDPASRSALLERLTALRDSDMALMLSSHQMEDLALLASSLTVLDRGQVALDGPIGEVFAQQEHLQSLGLDTPVTAQAAAKLRELGWDVPTFIVAPQHLLDWLEAKA